MGKQLKFTKMHHTRVSFTTIDMEEDVEDAEEVEDVEDVEDVDDTDN